MEIRNKKGFLARDYLVAMVVGVALIGLLYLMVQGMGTEYDNLDVINSSFNSSYNKFGELSDSAYELYSEASSDEGLSLVGSATLVFKSTTTIINLILETLLLPGDLLRQFALDSGAPSPIAEILFILPIVVILIIVTLAVISAITQRKI